MAGTSAKYYVYNATESEYEQFNFETIAGVVKTASGDSVEDVLSELKSSLGVNTKVYITADIDARDALTGIIQGDETLVLDASDDEAVGESWARYIAKVDDPGEEDWLLLVQGSNETLVVSWSNITSKPTTLSGYGITDAVTSDEVTTAAEANKILKLDADSKLPATAAQADKLATPRTITISGGAIGSAEFDGSENIEIEVGALLVVSSTEPENQVTGGVWIQID